MAPILVLMLIAAVVAMWWHLGYQERQWVASSPYIGCDKRGRSLLAGSNGYYAASGDGGHGCIRGGGHGEHGGYCGGGDGGGH